MRLEPMKPAAPVTNALAKGSRDMEWLGQLKGNFRLRDDRRCWARRTLIACTLRRFVCSLVTRDHLSQKILSNGDALIMDPTGEDGALLAELLPKNVTSCTASSGGCLVQHRAGRSLYQTCSRKSNCALPISQTCRRSFQIIFRSTSRLLGPPRPRLIDFARSPSE